MTGAKGGNDDTTGGPALIGTDTQGSEGEGRTGSTSDADNDGAGSKG